MEDVLDLYAQPPDPSHPVVCFDETSKQLVAEIRAPRPTQPGRPARHDYEYRRTGTANVFLHFCPGLGWRHVEPTERRTKEDFAHQMKALVDVHFKDALKVRVVLDNLNTHTPSALYEAFPPAEAKRLVDRLEFHHTPKHGSWLNMAETEFSILSRQCTSARIADIDALHTQIGAWEAKRNGERATIQWSFRVDDARTKLHRLYPSHPQR